MDSNNTINFHKDLGNMIACSACCTTHKNALQCPEANQMIRATQTQAPEIHVDDIKLEGF